MARFPVIEATATSSTNTAGTDHVVEVSNLAAAAGDLILILMNIGSTQATLNAHADYSELLDENLASGLKILYRWATGGEGDPTFVTSASTRDASIALRISGAINPATRLPQIGTTAATTDPPSVTPSQGMQEYLAIAMVGSSGEQLDNGSYVTAFPTGFDLAQLMKTCGTSGVNLGGLVGCAAANLQQSTAIDPGAFSVSESASRTQTIIIHPAVLVATPTGAGILERVGSGASAFGPRTFTKQNSGILVRSAVAADEIGWNEAGKATAPLSASGAKVVGAGITYEKAGSGIWGQVRVPFEKTGMGTLGLVGSGARPHDTVIYEKTGMAVMGLAASGATYAKTGSGVSAFSASGVESSVFVETGAGILSASASGTKEIGGGATYTKQNSGVLVASGAGARVRVITKSGNGTAVFSGTSADSLVWVESGAGILSASASGAKSLAGGTTYTKQNSASAVFTGTAADALVWIERGSGVLSASASGSKSVTGGATYTKQNSGTAVFSADGSDALVWIEDGKGTAILSASGTSQKGGGASKTGMGIRGHSGSAAELQVAVERGSGVLERSGSGSKSQTKTKTGVGVAVFVGSGAKVAQLGTTYGKSGAAILTSTAGAVRARTISRSSAGILDRSGAGRDVVSWSKNGSGLATFTASGERSYGHIPGSVTIVEQVGVEITLVTGLGASVGVSQGKKASVTVA